MSHFAMSLTVYITDERTPSSKPEPYYDVENLRRDGPKYFY